MYYTRLIVTCDPEYSDMLTAELAELGFDTFLETADGFEAFAEAEKFDREAVIWIQDKYGRQTSLTFAFDRIEKRNWNEEWEKSYEPIDVEGRCLIRADFHQPEKRYPHEVIITPKMSFGTGHHQTTYLMVKTQLGIDHQGKVVMDAGCGTAILSIVASKLGASRIEAFDIDEWSVINGKENIAVNGCANVNIQQGKIDEVVLHPPFDIILANINKNVLLAELETYAAYLLKSGLLMISGFYTGDVLDLLEHARSCGLSPVSRDEREGWACLVLEKI